MWQEWEMQRATGAPRRTHLGPGSSEKGVGRQHLSRAIKDQEDAESEVLVRGGEAGKA